MVRPRQDSLELASERFNQIARETQQLREGWNNRLVFPFTKLLERYLGGHIAPHIHLAHSDYDGDTPRRNVCLVFHHDVQRSGSHNVGPRGCGNKDEFPVLIGYVHIMNQPQRVIERIATAVRLQTVNSCKGSGAGDGLYFSTKLGTFSFVHSAITRVDVKDGKFNPAPSGISSGWVGELPSQMIQRRSQVMDDFASKNAESQWDLLVGIIAKFLPSLTVLLSDGGVDAFKVNQRNGSEMNSDFPFQITDVLIGPF